MCCLACRYETLYTGGFKGIIKTTTLSKLRADTLSVVDLDRLDARRNLVRKEMPVLELTELRVSAASGSRRNSANGGRRASVYSTFF